MTAHTYTLPDDPKMLRETLCVLETAYIHWGNDKHRYREHLDRLQRLIKECDRKRPLGSDCKHGNRHTPECGCTDV